MKRHYLIIACCMIGVFSSLAQAQQNQRQLGKDLERPRGLINDVTEAKIAMHPVTPFVDESTLALIRINLAQLDVEANAQLFGPIGGQDPMILNFAQGTVESLRRAGVDTFFVVAGTRSLTDGGPLVVLPCEDTTAVKNLAEMLISNLPNRDVFKSYAGNEVVLVGPTATVDRVLEAETVMRPMLVLPLTEQSDYHHLAVVAMQQQYRDELASLWPNQMPKGSLVELSPKQLAADLQSIEVAWNMLPQPDVRIEFVGADQAAVERIREKIEQLVAMIPQVADTVEVSATPDTVIVKAQAEKLKTIADTVVRPVRKQAEVMRVSNSLKQLGLGFHNYASAYKHVVPLYSTDPDGKPLYSWRVELLPFIDQQAIFSEFKRDQAWDSDANKKFSELRLPVYTDDATLRNKTTLRAPVYPGSLWHGDGPPREFRDVLDGTSNTIMFIDAPRSAAIEWANPEPWVLSDDLVKDIFGDRERVQVAMMDGAVLVLEKSETTNEELKALLTINGGERSP